LNLFTGSKNLPRAVAVATKRQKIDKESVCVYVCNQEE